MNVKRTIAIILILSIIVVAVFALSGCNITNDGSEDELKGIYGVTTMYYKSYEGKKYNVSGQYEYFLLVLNGDEGRTGKVIMKRDGDAEFSYDITYTPKFNSDGKTIWSITVNDFRLPEYEDETGKWKFSKNLLEFNKISMRTTDKKIERAKSKQTNSREKRGSTLD